MCDGYSDCGDDYEDDEEFPEPPAPQPVECPFGCGTALAVRRWSDQALVDNKSALTFRRWAELPCGHEGDKWVTTVPLGVAALMERTPVTRRQVVDLEPWTDPDRAPTEDRRKAPSGLFNWLNNWLRR